MQTASDTFEHHRQSPVFDSFWLNLYNEESDGNTTTPSRHTFMSAVVRGVIANITNNAGTYNWQRQSQSVFRAEVYVN